MFNGLLREKLLDFAARTQELERRLHNAVEQESEIYEQRKACYLQPLESLPAKAERDNPDEKGPACVDGGARGGTDATCNRKPEEVEAATDLD